MPGQGFQRITEREACLQLWIRDHAAILYRVAAAADVACCARCVHDTRTLTDSDNTV
jgi:hypothetical protein